MQTVRILSSLLLFTALNAQAVELDTIEKRASYVYGTEILDTLKAQGMELDANAYIQGVQDAAAGKKPRLDESESASVKNEFQQLLHNRRIAAQQVIARKNQKEGEDFLKQNATKEGVITTDSGLQYKVIKEGSGKQPTASDTVVTHYRGTLIDGREFDSSYKRNKPATFPVRGVIKGWTEALQLMKEGAKWELYIPSDLAYGATKRSELIQANSTLLFEIELLEVK